MIVEYTGIAVPIMLLRIIILSSWTLMGLSMRCTRSMISVIICVMMNLSLPRVLWRITIPMLSTIIVPTIVVLILSTMVCVLVVLRRRRGVGMCNLRSLMLRIIMMISRLIMILILVRR